MNIEDHLVEMHWEWGLKSFLTAAENITQLKHELEQWKNVAEFLAGIIAEKRQAELGASTKEEVINYAVSLWRENASK